MKTNRALVAAMTMGFMVLGTPSVFAQTAKSSGVFKIVKGDVRIKSGRDGKVVKAEIGTRVYASDTVITAADARAKIEMIDKNELNISPASQVSIQKYEFESPEAKKNVLLNVLQGKVRAKVNQKYDGQASHFQVETPSAVAGVRGTDFLTSYEPSTKTSQVVTFQGKVEWGQPGPNGTVQNPVMVKVGQTSVASASAPPSQPTPMSAAELKKADVESKPETAAPASAGGSSNGGAKNGSGNSNSSGGGSSGSSSSSGGSSSSSGSGGSSSSSGSGGGNSSGAGAGAGAGGGAGAAAGSGSGGATQASAADPGSDSGRAPAAVSGVAPAAPAATSDTSHSDLFNSNDLAGGKTPMAPPPLPVIPQLPTLALPNLTTIPKCDFCNQIIQNGSGTAQVKIHVTTSP
jgi:hypothetical protein